MSEGGLREEPAGPGLAGGPGHHGAQGPLWEEPLVTAMAGDPDFQILNRHELLIASLLKTTNEKKKNVVVSLHCGWVIVYLPCFSLLNVSKKCP